MNSIQFIIRELQKRYPDFFMTRPERYRGEKIIWDIIGWIIVIIYVFFSLIIHGVKSKD